MEEKNNVKKNNTPIFIMIFAALLIIAGVALILTGNNKSFWKNKKTDNANKEQQESKGNEEDIPDRGLTPTVITEKEILQLLIDKKQSEFPEENWGVDYVNIIAHDEEYEKILVSYGEFQEDSSVVVKQTIVSILNGEKDVELPGWIEGERDLTVYNFIMNESEILEEDDLEPDLEFEEPVLEDYEYAGPSLDE